MKLSAKEESDLMKVYNTWWNSYLNGDVVTYDSYLADDYRFVGSTNNEEFLSKNDTTDFFRETADQLAGKAELRNTIRNMEILDNGLVLITDLADAWVTGDPEWVYYSRFRFTSLLRKNKQGWRFIYQHFSEPDSKAQKGETLGLEQVSKENLELRDAVKRRTAELAHKNRELEIDAALERTRTQSMLMQYSSELDKTSKVFHEQLQKLGIQSAFSYLWLLDEENEKQTFWATYSEEKNGVVSYSSREVSFHLDKTDPYMAECLTAWREGEKTHMSLIPPKEVEHYLDSWDELFSEVEGLNKEYFPDGLRFIDAYMKYGTFGLVSNRNLNEEEYDILCRFAIEFERTYSRFLDLQKAEAQAREAQIETALERVRARTMGMQKSEELTETTFLLSEQLKELGEEIDQITIGIIKEDEKIIEAFGTMKGDQFQTLKVPIDEKFIMGEIYKAWKRKKDSITIEISGKKLQRYNVWRNKFVGKNIYPIDNTRGTWIVNAALFSKGLLSFSSEKHVSQDTIRLLERFASVFDLTYTRFNDLLKAEKQAREAQIEASLERVRSRSIGMQKSEELKEVIQVIHDQLILLNFKIDAAGFTMDYFQNNDWNIWIANKEQSLPSKIYIPYIDHPQFKYYKGAKEKGLDFFANTLSFEDKNSIFNYMFEFMGDYPLAERDQVLNAPGLAISQAFLKNITLWIYNLEGNPYTEEDNDILMRFARVFEQTYVRFNDLQKAEKQAREAQIEAALERVRSRSMAMHQSTELLEVANVLFQQLRSLGGDLWASGVVICKDDSNDDEVWFANEKGVLPPIAVPHTEDPSHKKMYDGWKKKMDLLSVTKEGLELKAHYNYMLSVPSVKPLFENILESGLSFPENQTWYAAYFNFGYLLTITLDPYPDEKVFVRFAKVFNQAYTRFLDLQKAEAQTREAQIEASLERVRSKTMAMHNSHDMGLTVETLFEQVLKLELDNDIRCGIGILEGKERMETRSATLGPNGEVDLKIGMLDMTIHPMLKRIIKAWKSGGTHFKDQMAGKDVVRYYTALNNEPDYPFYVDLETLPKKEFHNSFSFSEGILFAFSPNPMSEEAAKVMDRFAQVFGQTYRRFVDLQKAEAQVREAQIEAALERIRTQAMAMQHSNDLIKSTSILFEELEKLELPLERCGIGIFDKETRDCQLYTTVVNDEGKTELATGITSLTVHPMLIKTFDAWKVQESLFYVLEGKELSDYYKLVSKSKFHLPKDVLNKSASLAKEYYFYMPFGAGGLYVFSDIEPTIEETKVIRRFAEVFHMTYTRYEDLQKAETRALEAIKQSSLDRVRGEIASMRSTEDLQRITPLIWKELETLGVPFNRCGVFIVDKPASIVRVYLTTNDGIPLGVLNLPTDGNELIRTIMENWKSKTVYSIHWNKNDFITWMQSMIKLGQVQSKEEYQGNVAPPEKLDLHFIPFAQGLLYVGHSDVLAKDKIELVKSLARAFEVAYARYEDFKQLEDAKHRVDQTLSELKSAQTQLIHAEKMASLGELTAGIAHEIQNPLNFVNNFSEVSVDLIEEMDEEMTLGNTEDVKEIANDLKQNLEKIHHHGKRASFIVQGMLEHSRTNPGDKKPTDINVLADEFLRLSYHGLRAKDKSFNAEMITEFDKDLPEFNIIPQDIGRVLLNLFNNAFYACAERSRSVVTEKQKVQTEAYKPTVLLSTKKVEDVIEIKIKDNGSGIPEDVLKKIFQPFFTTKPTGEGTGLGLSMSFDIITKGHGGDIKVSSTVGEGTEFIIQIPA